MFLKHKILFLPLVIEFRIVLIIVKCINFIVHTVQVYTNTNVTDKANGTDVLYNKH